MCGSAGNTKISGFLIIANDVFRSNKVLASYQPLQHHQQQYNVETPWKEVHVRVTSGHYRNHLGIIKNARRDFRGSLRLSLYLIAKRCSIEMDHLDVVELQYVSLFFLSFFINEPFFRTAKPLQDYSPLQEDQLHEFGVNPLFYAMCTGPVPWVGFKVDFVHKNYKSEYGVVQGVDRYQTDNKKKSGLMLMVERYTFTALGSNQLVKVDYDDVRYHKYVYPVTFSCSTLMFSPRTNLFLCDVYQPTEKQSFYLPNPPAEDESQTSSVPSDVASTPMPTEWEKWTIFMGPWSATYDYSPQSPTPSMFWSPSPLPSSLSLPPAEPPLEENIFGNAWILHPGLAGIEIAVDIKPSASLGSLGKKFPVYVKRLPDSNENFQLTSGQTIVPWQLVIPFHDRPKPATEKRLMVVA